MFNSGRFSDGVFMMCSIGALKTTCIALLSLASAHSIMAKDGVIPFKHGYAMKKEDVENFSRRTGFTVPRGVLTAYDRWNGGGIDGWLVFDMAGCEKMAVTKFFSLRHSASDPFSDLALTEIKRNVYLSSQSMAEIRLLPLAVVNGSVSQKEANNPLNCRSVLVLKRDEGDRVFLLSGKDGSLIKVAESFREFLSATTFWFQFVDPAK